MPKTTRPSAKAKKRHSVEKADLRLARSAAGWRDHPVVRALGRVSELADQPQLYTLSAATAVLGIVGGDAKLMRAGIRMLAAEWLATKAKSFLKHHIDRTRPHVPVDGGPYRFEQGKSHDTELNSFPSGHTAGAVAVARAYTSEYPEHLTIATTLAIGIGLIQLPRGKHYLTDIGVGAAIGLGAGAIVAKRVS
ncbi:phosphatase PAP2 family protein [Sphingomonas nostoxanthinifaciens]|uniref:phosphatase PAP2 family protein n=1 Tax=Sphingomonas nostoxanthinifaciens TaxID=2872652 RepID=UPI001CC1FB60|nr:phosphatase PAP2 family protein [Sphingomonas nostoxanthinifaciens]UAK25677.1 phosphatase PAP2 family protein [Sphingomonas nostoxanthinifaciens]